MFQFRQHEGTKHRNTLSIPSIRSLSSGSQPPPPFFLSLFLMLLSSHGVGRESPHGHFYKPTLASFHPQFQPPPLLPNSSFAHQAQREPLKQHLAPTHPHTSTEFLLTPASITHALSFSLPYTSNTWKDALRGPGLKGELEVGVRKRRCGGGMKAVLEREMSERWW